MRAAWLAAAALALAVAFGAASEARAASPAQYCRQAGTDDTVRPLPASLLPVAVRLFHLEAMPAPQVLRSTYFRCAEGDVWLCNTGANLPCGKADTRRTLPGATAWCSVHPGADFIPMYATGHATIYRWRCNGAKPAIAGTVHSVDRRGFIAQYWKPAAGG